jgi:hypothetical protein
MRSCCETAERSIPIAAEKQVEAGVVDAFQGSGVYHIEHLRLDHPERIENAS